MIESLLLTTARLCTYLGGKLLTAASSFFFERDGRLYLVTSRHVLHDPLHGHEPDRVEFELHRDASQLSNVATVSMPLYRSGVAAWHQAEDSGGEVDVAVLEVGRQLLPEGAMFHRFTPDNLAGALEQVEAGSPILVPGYPLGFYDTVHRLPVLRSGCIASSFGVRFQGKGYFLTDARTHRGSSGSPVVQRLNVARPALPWRLLGVHSSRMDMLNRDVDADESLGLNSVWYADVLLTLTAVNADTPSP
ncbi:MAG TPA: serine protease [Burkholderiaceae bacterium]|nr:serine protease [Burkholderiaceae bacterium]